MQNQIIQAAATRRSFLIGAGLAGLGAVAPAPLLAKTAPLALPHVSALLDDLVGKGKVAGAIAALSLGGHAPRYLGAGHLALDSAAAPGPDTLFRIYSMTKAVTGLAASILIDAGKLRLDQPVADVLPAFARMQVLAEPNAPLDRVSPAKAPITMRQLLTHTAGLGYAIIQQGPIRQAYLDAGLGGGQVGRKPVPGERDYPPAPSLAVFADRLAALPLVYEPGSQWSYSLGLDLMGRVIEVVGGKPFDRFVHDEILGPCGMASTGFQVPAAQAHRLASNYGVSASGLVLLDGSTDSIYTDKPSVPFGGSGLVSSPRDFDRFMAALAGLGRLNGRRALPAGAVQLTLSDMLPATASTKGTWAEGMGHGAGAQVGLGKNLGAFGWSGAAGTVFRLDWKRGIRAGFYTQYMPSSAYAVSTTFPKALDADIRAPQLVF